MTEQPHEQVETGVADSDPNAAGPEGLAGDMGLSSERTGPAGSAPVDSGVQGTGTRGTAAASTHGVLDTTGEDTTDEDDPAQEEGDGPSPATGIDRTVGESNPAEVPSHRHDPARNPGHSHG